MVASPTVLVIHGLPSLPIDTKKEMDMDIHVDMDIVTEVTLILDELHLMPTLVAFDTLLNPGREGG